MGRPVVKAIQLAAVLVVVMGTLAGLATQTQAAVQAAAKTGGTATFAISPGRHPTFIFPFETLSNFSIQNSSYLDYLLYRPLYWFGQGSTPDVNSTLSLANAPEWNSSSDVVTIHLKPYSWSDGTKLTPANVAFWMGLEWSEKNNWGGYTPGYFPDDLTSVAYSDVQDTVTFTLNAPVNQQWFLYNELAQITPLPSAWDETAFGDPSSCASELLATEMADCPAVWNFLTKQSEDLTTYASSPLWRVVDGPWVLKAFSLDGPLVFTPNPSYSGPQKPHLTKLTYVSFTSDAAEYDALRAGDLTVGYLPLDDAPEKGSAASANPVGSKYYTVTVGNWAVNFLDVNYNNPLTGPLVRQLYVRQALEYVVDQKEDVKVAYKGYGMPTYGPVPVVPATNLLSSNARHPLYPFDVSAARKALTSHGWTIPSTGPAKCAKAGTGQGECGAGIGRGTTLEFNLSYGSGNVAASQIIEAYKTTAAEAGIVINLDSTPVDVEFNLGVKCTSQQSDCKWQILWPETGWTWIQPYLPSGELLLDSHSAADTDSYDSPKMDSLIAESLSSASLGAFRAYENYAAQQLPLIWFPETTWSVEEVAKDLRGVTPAWPVINLTPESWYYVK